MKLVEFFQQICGSKEIEMRRAGCYNLPCFHSLYKDYQEELQMDCHELYVHFSTAESDLLIKKSVAASIHQAFLLSSQEENTMKLRDCVKVLLEDQDKEVVRAMVEHLDVTIQHYSNEQAVKTYFVVSPKSTTTKNRKISTTNADFTTTVDKTSSSTASSLSTTTAKSSKDKEEQKKNGGGAKETTKGTKGGSSA